MKENKIIFVGGIHGVGKGAICKKICKSSNFIHITASEILKWNEISEPNNKRVSNIQSTQDRLLEGLSKIVKKGEGYLLDGHFCLLNSKNEVEKVPIETFNKISPKLIAVVTAEVGVTKERLEKRDNKSYNFDLLKSMQTCEIKYAQQISLKLKVPFIEIKDGNYHPLVKVIS